MAYTPRLLFSAARNWRRVLPLMRDERVPTALKAGTALLGVLIVSPLDVFGDIPVIGVLDDAVLLTVLCSAFVMLATRLTLKPAAVSASSPPGNALRTL